jgi:cell wall-associated NlpC family hydrolase
MRRKFKETIICGVLALLVISSVLFVENITSASDSVGFSEKGILKEEWRYDLSWYSWGWFGSSPAILDLGTDVNKKGGEPDSDFEIITGSDEYCRYYPELGKYTCGIWRVFDSKGNVEWAKDTQTDESRSSPVVADLDGDRDLEIVGGTTSGYYLQVLDHLGNFVWTFPKLPEYYTSGPFLWPSSAAVGDINKGINGLEVVIGNRVDGKVYVFDGANNNKKNDGITMSSLPWFPYPLGIEGKDWDVLWTFEPPEGIGVNGIVSTPAIANVDKDEELEVVVGSTNGYLYILNAPNGNLEYKFKTGGPIYSSPALANIDIDKYLEIIVGSTDGKIYSFQWDGASGKTEWQYPTQGAIYSSPAIEDIDEDGKFEIIIGSNDSRIYALSASGSEEWSYLTDGAVYSSPAIANRGKDFGFDIYVGSDDGYLYLLDGKTGTKIDRFQVYRSWFGGIHTSPSIADIDGDNKLEIVFYDWGQGSTYGGHTFWVVEDTKSQVDKYSIQWGMFRGNPSRTGSFRIRPFNAVELAKEVIKADYLWGGKGYNPSATAKEFFASPTIKDIGYNYWNPCEPYYDSAEKKCKCYNSNTKKFDEECGPYYHPVKKKCECKGKIDFGKGLDCSGLIFWTYNRAYFEGMKLNSGKFGNRPLFYEGATQQYRGNTKHITKQDLRPGDLLFYNPSGDKNKEMTHVMMYVGPFTYEGKQYNVIHAEGVSTKKITPAIYSPETEEVITPGAVTLKVTAYGRVSDYKLDILFVAHSPVDLIVTDPEGEVITKDMMESLSMAYMNYDIDGDGKVDDVVAIPERKIGDYLIQVVPEPDALPTDTYSLEITAAGQTIVLAKNVPISDIPRVPYIIRSMETEIIPIIPAFVDFDPDTLNLKSKGKWVTTYVELPIGYDINEIDLESIKLNDQIPIEAKPTEIGDYDENGIPDLMVKFDRLAVQNILEVGEEVKVTISGKLIDEKPFEGSNIIRVIDKNKK